MNPLRLRHLVGEIIGRRELWSAGERVAVAVSGGMDSVTLLDLLVQTVRWHGGRLSVVSVDHGTRAGSAADLNFVGGLAENYGLEFVGHEADLGARASEADCRALRLRVFAALPVARVALAHTLDDQAETLILQLMRGAGARGLGGMRWRVDRRVRPLLDTSRSAVRAYAVARGLVWREDPTNADPRYLRNRVRSEVLPLLEDLRAGSTATLARAASHLAADEHYFDALVPSDELGWQISWLRSAPVPIARRFLGRALPGVSAGAIDAILALATTGEGTRPLSDGRVVCIRAGRVVVRRTTEAPPTG